MSDRVSISRIRKYNICHRQAFMFDRHRGNLKRPPSKSQPAMTLGSIVHFMLEKSVTVGEPIKILSTTEQQMIYLEAVSKYDWAGSLVDKAYNIFQQYFRWLNGRGSSLLGYRVIANELTIKDNIFSGRVDLVVQHIESGVVRVLDYKTTSGDLLDLNIDVRLNEQFILYTHRLMKEYSPTGVLVVGLKTKEAGFKLKELSNGRGYSIDKQQNLSYETFTEALRIQSVPQDNYLEYIEWLQGQGTNNIIVSYEYEPAQVVRTLKRLEKKANVIQSLQTLDDCEPTVTYTCSKECPMFAQCVDIEEGKIPDFSMFSKQDEKKVKVGFSIGV